MLTLYPARLLHREGYAQERIAREERYAIIVQRCLGYQAIRMLGLEQRLLEPILDDRIQRGINLTHTLNIHLDQLL